MKELFLIILFFPLLSWTFESPDDDLIGIWELNQVTLNQDTIFFRGHFDYTLKHNFERNKSWVNKKEDSLAVVKRAEEGYQNAMSIKLEFLTDSIFKMTKVRGGRRVSPKEFDYGTYIFTKDTLYLTNQSRRNYKTMYIFDNKNNRIFQRDGLPTYMVNQEYKKIS